ncbi:branched-chain amino acid ABC transporter substrate-binding protein [Aestuariivirga litoralis]|uniref:branched-chain amino acid ABC transporter substrate-binding protein n=1 Tax=Aestuariivirga litoralis TaxID=2650924 RepID=UPI0018C4AD9B|nr:branched-chain amino acid ABC transporter substrate-binding protein [Aestuariivirga litoralis]MBG1231242.1 ABC transporter substrate-binding protein [Aestuariivirga litoralis]
MIRSAVAGLFLVMAWAGINTAKADIVIGVEAPLSGQYQPFGQQLLGGAKAAVDAINARGGIKGETLTLISADDICDSAKAEDAAQKLIEAKADVVIGSFCSNPSLAAARVLDKAGVMMISPAAMLPSLTESGLSNVLRLAARMDAQGAFAAKRVLAKRPQAKLALLDDGTPAMKSITQSFAAAYAKGATLIASFTPDQKDYADLIGRMKEAGIDTLYIAASATDAGHLAAQAEAAGLSLRRYGPDSLLADLFWQASGAAGEATLVSFPADPMGTREGRDLAAELKSLNVATDGPTLPAYAAVEVYAAAAQAKGPHAGAALAAWARSGQPITTRLGPLSFDPKGDLADLHFSWFSWNNGQYQTIAPETQ